MPGVTSSPRASSTRGTSAMRSRHESAVDGHLPEPVVRIEIAVGVAELGETRGQHLEMPRLVDRDADPIPIVVASACRESGRPHPRRD